MTRIQGLTLVAGLLCGTFLWFTASRAEDDSVVPVPTDQVAALAARIEKLEKRIVVLENKESATRQVNAVYTPWAPQMLPAEPRNGGITSAPPKTGEPVRPKAQVFLLRHIEPANE